MTRKSIANNLNSAENELLFDVWRSLVHSTIERLSMTLRQTANGKNETFADCF